MKKESEQLVLPAVKSFLTDDGSELPDPRPVALPVGFERPETIQQMIRRLITDPRMREELSGGGAETFDEADDFEIPEDDTPRSPYEEQFDPLHLVSREQEIANGMVAAPTAEELSAAADIIARARAAAAQAKRGPQEPPEAAPAPVQR